ncbi:MAG TPA: ribose-5-phosphate isomerase RpiA [Reyranella sp.]|jgi:ribose 5-phosphate isomerase A
MDADRAKQLAAEAAFDRVADGTCLALGTGSTVEAGLPRLAARVREGLRITCVSSSERTVHMAATLGLPLVDLDTIKRIDMLIDGADQVAPDLTMIKGRGGALTREKKLAAIAAHRIYAIDSNKQVPVLGDTWLPVEVLPYGWRFTLAAVGRTIGGEVRVREEGGAPQRSDNGNYLADGRIGVLTDAARLDRALQAIPGVIETGLFVGFADLVIVSDGASVTVNQKKN